MPIYEYQCLQCKTVHEIWQKISERPLSVCSDCGGPLQKLVSLSSFQLKGGGWYADGYTDKTRNGTGQDKKEDAGRKSQNQPAAPADHSKPESEKRLTAPAGA